MYLILIHTPTVLYAYVPLPDVRPMRIYRNPSACAYMHDTRLDLCLHYLLVVCLFVYFFFKPSYPLLTGILLFYLAKMLKRTKDILAIRGLEFYAKMPPRFDGLNHWS